MDLDPDPDADYFLKVLLHQFSKVKSQKEVTKQQKSRFFLLFLLNDRRTTPLGNGSGFGSATLDSRVKNHLCTNDLYGLVRNAFDACRYITWGSGGPLMALACRLVPFHRGPQNSRFPAPTPPTTSPRNVSARIKSITHEAV
jgi:hypothetical protein